MRRRLRLLLVPILAVALPLAALAVIGAKWLALDREAAARRTEDAAREEAARVRGALLTGMAAAAAEVERTWPTAAPDRPFAPQPRLHPLVAEAYRFAPDGRLEDPDYDTGYQRAVRASVQVAEGPQPPDGGGYRDAFRSTRLALSLLDAGRQALGAGRAPAAAAFAEKLLDCCAAARDEYGVSLAVLAARQTVAAWRLQGILYQRLADLMNRLVALAERGSIGHPNDVVDVAGFVRMAGDLSRGAPLLARVRESAAGVIRVTKTAERLTRWLAASGQLSATDVPFEAALVEVAGQKVLVGRRVRPSGGTLVLLFDITALTDSLAGGDRPGDPFEATLAVGGSAPEGHAAASVPLLAGAPGLQVVVRPRPSDTATQERRTTLFGAALLAALGLVLFVAYLGLRDIAREVNLAEQQASFVASVSHELKTPVASIRLLAETLRMGSASDPAESGALLDEIVEQADRQARLIDNVLGVARIDRRLPMYHAATLELGQAADQVLRRLEYLIRQEGFTVTRRAPQAPLFVNADPDGLDQAVTNLVTNAVKYSGRCRGIRVEIDRVGDEAVLRVVDGGIGIEPAEQRRIFDRFYRARAAARETGGAGLGLALVRHFADSHGGSVSVESAPGRGSTFTLRLPVAADAPAARAPEP